MHHLLLSVASVLVAHIHDKVTIVLFSACQPVVL